MSNIGDHVKLIDDIDFDKRRKLISTFSLLMAPPWHCREYDDDLIIRVGGHKKDEYSCGRYGHIKLTKEQYDKIISNECR